MFVEAFGLATAALALLTVGISTWQTRLNGKIETLQNKNKALQNKNSQLSDRVQELKYEGLARIDIEDAAITWIQELSDNDKPRSVQIELRNRAEDINGLRPKRGPRWFR